MGLSKPKKGSAASKALYQKLNVNLLYQVDKSLYENIQKYGCRFMSMIAIPQIVCHKALTSEQILEIYNAAVSGQLGEEVMRKDCCAGKNEHKMINMAFRMLDGERTNKYCRQMWVSDYANEHKNPSELPGPNNILFYIVDYLTGSDVKTYGGHHFCLHNSLGHLIYDPANGTIKKYKGVNRFLVYKVFTDRVVEDTTTATESTGT